jgi:hypothetical protein
MASMTESGKPADDGRCTGMSQSAGSKQIKVECLRNGQASDLHKAPPSRVYTRDYGKVQEKDDPDLVTGALGNPLRW